MPTLAKRDPGGAVLLAHLGDGNPRQPSECRLYFATVTAGSWFLGLRWLDTALDFPIEALDPIQSSVKPEHSRTPSWQQNVFVNCGTWVRILVLISVGLDRGMV
jgi:hypothetical protein